MLEPKPVEAPFTRTPSPEEIVLAAQRQRWGGLTEELSGEFDRASQQVVNRVFRAIREGSLTQEASMLAWQELYALEKIRKRMGAKASEGLDLET